MTFKRVHLITNSIYHVYNRSVGYIRLFHDKRNVDRFVDLLDFYRFPHFNRFSKYNNLPIELRTQYLEKIITTRQPIVELYSYDCHDDHFHIQLKQLQDNGIRNYISNIQNGYAKFFNTKNQRSGSVFQNPFKTVYIKSEDQLIHLSRYIHLQPVTDQIIEFDQLAIQPGNSFIYYNGKNIAGNRLFEAKYANSNLINTEYILSLIGSTEKYRRFIANQVDYQRKLAQIKKLLPLELRKIRDVLT